MPKLKRTYRIEQETADKLSVIASELGVTATDALEKAIRAYDAEPYESHTAINEHSEALDALAKQLDVLQGQLVAKDKQIKALSAALVSAQDTAKAAQALQAAGVADALVLRRDSEPQTRWQRLKAAWKGGR